MNVTVQNNTGADTVAMRRVATRGCIQNCANALYIDAANEISADIEEINISVWAALSIRERKI
ncbi:hypothetical protein RS75_15445 [Rhizobium nepotum 39/7]|uniref:Uncharacterized protein n=1 Tax=Rhizobium nepotum 39/7 TaxID=1368418 RepID=A0ABR5CQF8_9HYPH|nr:hypothetical protein RS75_15445 [Rhizobium nepotum 39/7]